MAEITAVLLSLLFIFVIASGTRFLVQNIATTPYTVVLVLVGFGTAILDLDLTIELSHDIILFIFLPAIVFQGATEINFSQFRENLPITVPIVLGGLPGAIVILGILSQYALGLPLLAALLFAAMIYPIDPVAVIALFREMDVPERLSVLTESESLMDDGLAIVVFSAIFSLFQEYPPTTTSGTDFATRARLTNVVFDFLVGSVGGIIVGLVTGYVVYRVMRHMDDRMNEFLLTVVVAYGSFLIADHFFAVNGILATVAGGLLLGTTGREYALRPETAEFCRNTWEAIVFIVNTILFLLIGAEVAIGQFIQQVEFIVLATVLVLIARATVIYSITFITNRFVSQPVPLNYRHVLIWGGMHAAIPVALVLSLPPGTPFRNRLRTLVFGVVVLSITVQGVLMPYVLRMVGIIDSEASRAAEA